MIIKDIVADILATLCSNIKHSMKPIIAEALALRKAMNFYIKLELKLSRVILEGDS